jgi:hypothetical protein
MNEDGRAHERLTVLEERVSTLETGMSENTAITKTIDANTKELVTLIKGAKGLRAFVMWATPLLATISVAFTYLKGHWK